MANPISFDRDFGYLLPFMDKVASAASELPDASARQELVQLMAEEKLRWERIRSLLQGAPGRGASAASSREAARLPTDAPPLARVSADGVNRVARREAGFTVGSLKNSR
ncbi:hypothetical protein [Corallococcus llansteffanensis]|uniref:Uncharacterized protein n=1 Tax=Corallococcus llansteffanensis TaxID=2316731 RepID=A0A3A8PCC3_9BACT|nr:hypothetical protein [Corallococcus llansteffanensis]RKH54106.1 hypothetical protein D7V93_26060 [Corallococcus llansteffanensis]